MTAVWRAETVGIKMWDGGALVDTDNSVAASDTSDELRGVSPPMVGFDAISAVPVTQTLTPATIPSTPSNATAGDDTAASLPSPVSAPGTTIVNLSQSYDTSFLQPADFSSNGPVLVPPSGDATFSVTTPGSALVFNNTVTGSYSGNTLTQFENDIISAETILEKQATNSFTINVELEAENQGANGDGADNNSEDYGPYTYSQLKTALTAKEAGNPIGQIALQHLPATDPSGGVGFYLPTAYARFLGLSSASGGIELINGNYESSASYPFDSAVILNTNYVSDYGQDAIDALTHELSESAMGRVGGLGAEKLSNGVSLWTTMDLFRYNSAGQYDTADGKDGQAAYFSYNGGQTTSASAGLSFFNNFNTQGVLSGGDNDDWNSSSASDIFGPVSTVSGLSQTDDQILEALGWTPPGSVTWVGGASGAFSIAANWSPVGVPGATSDVMLPAGASNVVWNSGNETVHSLSTGAGANLFVTGGAFTITNGTGTVGNAGALGALGGLLKIGGTITGNGQVVIEGGSLDLAGGYAGNVTFNGAGGTFIGDAGNHNLVGDGQGNTIDYSAATSPVEFDLVNGLAYNNFGGATVGTDHFSNLTSFIGGSGTDLFVAGPGGDHFFNGQGGINTVSYAAATSEVYFDLVNHLIYNNLSGNTVTVDSFANLQSFIGGAGNDIFIAGPGGNHGFDGGGGINTVSYAAATSEVYFDLENRLIYNNLSGSTVTTDGFANLQAFVGGAGNDIFIAGPGGNHGFDGGGGVNTLSYIAATSSVYFDLTDQIIYDNLNGATVTTDRVANIKAFIGGSGNNVFVSSGPSGDIINGGAGGINTLQYSSPTANTTFDLTADTATANGVADIFANMQILVGSSGNDTFIGGPGNHTFIGNGGVNAISYANTTGNTEFDLVHDLAYNDHQGKSPVTVDSFSGVQVFVGGSSTNTFIGSGGGYVFVGGPAANAFEFGVGFGDGTINNFVHGSDIIQLPKSQAANLHFSQSGANTMITFNGDSTDAIALSNYSVGSLQASDFRFA
jgi:hypothetical protein